MRKWIAGLLAMGMIPIASADDHRASANYTLYCQGCHLARAEGYKNAVPRMRDFVGYFLHSQEGREFIIRVPGVATSALPDDQLTELINWLLLTYSGAQLPQPFEPYSVAEVSALRPQLEEHPEEARIRILREIARELPALADELATQDGR